MQSNRTHPSKTRSLAIVLALAHVALAACQPVPQPTPPFVPPLLAMASAEALRLRDAIPIGCTALREIDYSKLSSLPETTAPWPERSTDAHARLRAGVPQTPPTGPLVLRMVVGAGYIQSEKFETSSIAARGADGVWRFSRVDYYLNRPHGGPAQDHVVSEGVMAADLAARLDAAFYDPCMPFEPTVTPPRLPQLDGTYGRPCLDGAGYTLEIERGDRLRTVQQLCETRFASGAVIRVMEGVRK